MYDIVKRLLDLFIAIIALIVLSPVFIITIIVLALTGEHEVFYPQRRVGYKQKEFKMWKFATMVKDSEKIGNKDMTLRNDPRVTKVGTFLRKTKINELPQIFNVIIGNMSIVGPRPLMRVSFDMYLPEHKDKVYNSKPGITGIGPLLMRDEEKIVSDAVEKDYNPRDFYKNHIYPYKGKVEMWYQKKKSIKIDVLIIVLTAWVIIFPNSLLPYKVFKTVPQRPKEFDN
jgi:lipopolysaccharide/colanic/teichoic acid biosynthesis glycosyltransferase